MCIRDRTISTGGSSAPLSFVISPTCSIPGNRSLVTSMGNVSISLPHTGSIPHTAAAVSYTHLSNTAKHARICVICPANSSGIVAGIIPFPKQHSTTCLLYTSSVIRQDILRFFLFFLHFYCPRNREGHRVIDILKKSVGILSKP